MKTNINCNTIQISALLDNELTPELEKQSLEHIKNCPKCTKIYNELLQANSFLSQYTNQAPSPELYNKILSKPKINVFKYSSLAVAASVLFGIFSGLLLSNTISQNPSTEISEDLAIYENASLYNYLGE